MDSYGKNWKDIKIIFSIKKTMSLKKRTEVNLKNSFHKTSFSKKSKELH